ncbi:MAG: hypothetical protein CMI53_02295 [Parcubacteria group bacterium]|nr:hypothetical protein [Parcubacteria group bacterium]
MVIKITRSVMLAIREMNDLLRGLHEGFDKPEWQNFIFFDEISGDPSECRNYSDTLIAYTRTINFFCNGKKLAIVYLAGSKKRDVSSASTFWVVEKIEYCTPCFLPDTTKDSTSGKEPRKKLRKNSKWYTILLFERERFWKISASNVV